MAADPIQQLTETRAEEVTLRAIATDWLTPGHTPLAMTHAVLAALADAGLLVPAGGKARQEPGIRLGAWGNVGVLGWSSVDATHTRTITTYPDGTVVTAPWAEIPRPTIGGVE